MQRYDVQICLISGQPTPNLIPVLSPETRPKEVVLLVSEGMKKQAGNLEDVFRRYQVRSRREAIADPYDINAVHTQLESLVEGIRKENPARSVVVNLTGGTKPMAIGAQTACFYKDVPYFYMNIENGEMQLHQLPDDAHTQYQLQGSLKMRDYLEAHGYRLEEKAPHTSSGNENKTRQLLNTLGLNHNSFAEAIGWLNKLAHEAEEKKTLSVALEGEATPDRERLLREFSDAGVLTVKDGRICFRSEEDRFFANGGWLEEAVFEEVNSLNFQECKKNITVRSKENSTENEIDVAFMVQNRLYLIECKTSNFANDRQMEQNILYKLDSLSRQGGLNTRGMLVSYRKLTKAVRNRAKDLRIDFVEAKQLPDLKNRIRSWVSKGGR